MCVNKKLLAICVILLLTVFFVVGCETPEETVEEPPEEPEEVDIKEFEGETLIVGTWSGPFAESMDEAIFQPFEEETGVNIEYAMAWDHTPEIIAAPEDDPPVDVTLAAGDFLKGMRHDLWLPIRYENVPNAYEVWPNLLQEMGPFTEDDMPMFGVPMDLAIHVLLYRKDLVEEEPTRWMDLWRDEYKDRIMLENYPPYNYYLGAFLSDLYPDSADEIYDDEEGHDALIEALAAIARDHGARWYVSGAELVSAMEDEEVIVANYWHGSALVQTMEEPDKYGMVFPEEGASAYLDYFVVVRGTDKRDLAEYFVNYALDAEVQSRFAETHNQLVANKNAEVPEAMADFYPTSEEEWEDILIQDIEFLEPYTLILDDRLTREVLIY